MADYRLRSYDPSIPGIWEYERLDEFGQLAVSDLDDFASTAELYNQSLINMREFASKAGEVQARKEISQDQSLGIKKDAFLSGVPHTFDGIVEKKLIGRSLAPRPTKTTRTSFSVNPFPLGHTQIDDVLLVSKDIVEKTSHTVRNVDGTTSTKQITGPVITYRIEFRNPTEVNFLNFFSATPIRLLNITYRSAGNIVAVVADRQAFGPEKIYFDAATVTSIDIVVNQPLRIFNVLSEYVFAISQIDTGLNFYPNTWTWQSPDFSFIEDIQSVEIYASETSTTASPLPAFPKSIGYRINADKEYHIVRRDNKVMELSTNPASDRRLIKCDVIPTQAGNKLFIPVNADVINVFENALQLPLNIISSVGSVADDNVISGNKYSGSTPPNYVVEITSTGYGDTYQWSSDGGATFPNTGKVMITNDEQPLDNGMSIITSNQTGHAVGDRWTFKHSVKNNQITNTSVDFREGFEYFADVAFTNHEDSYIIYPQGHRASVKVDFHSFLGDKKNPPILEELWVRIRLKRETYLF